MTITIYWGRFLFIILLPFLMACNNLPSNYPKVDGKNGLVIALQPLQFEKQEVLDSISHYIEAFYGAKVVVWEDMVIPIEFKDETKGLRYSAGSIISNLKESLPDTVSLVLGITDEDIFTTKKDENGNIKKPEYKYAVWGIFGLGYLPGKSCVVSTRRLKHSEQGKMYKRIRNVVLHEIGHNLGLKHCENKKCIMTDANESIATIDNGSNEICKICKTQLRKRGYLN